VKEEDDISMLNSVLWNINILRSINLVIYKTIVKLYAAETGSTKRKQTYILAIKMDYLRGSARISRMGRI
jgi:hypothetical protein